MQTAIPSLLPRLLRRLRDRAGVAAIEFAIIAPMLILLGGAAWDLGTAIERSIRLENAARAGAQYIARAPDDAEGAQSVAQAVLAGYGSVSIGAMECRCPPQGAATGGDVVGCSGTCSSGMARYITVRTTPPADPGPLFPVSRDFITSIRGAEGHVVVRLQ